MLRAIWFAVKLGLLVAVAVWVANRPGYVDISWLGYDVRAQVGFVLLALLLSLSLLLILHRIFLGIVNFRKFLKRRSEEKRRTKGYKALTLGLSAVAAGDAKIANYQAFRMRKLIPDDRGLSYVLEGQAARLNGDDDAACGAFEKLLKNEDTAFLGLRGLITIAVEKGDTAQALSYARHVSKKHARQPWVARAVYDLELRDGQWQNALVTLKKAEKNKIITPERAHSDRIAIYLQQAEVALALNKTGEAQRFFAKALKLDPHYAPTAINFARYCIIQNKRRKAVSVIEQAWKENPHPELAALWGKLVPAAKKKKGMPARFHWFEKLVALKPDSAEGLIAAAEACVDENLWGEARHYLERAQKYEQSARLYNVWVVLAEAQGNDEESREMMKKAASAKAGKVWTCTETGRVYARWSPIAEPHGAFNTIIWGYPQLRESKAVGQLSGAGQDLLSAPSLLLSHS